MNIRHARRWFKRRAFLLDLVEDTSQALQFEQTENTRLRRDLHRATRNYQFALDLVETRDRAHAELADRCRRAEQARDILEDEVAALAEHITFSPAGEQ